MQAFLSKEISFIAVPFGVGKLDERSGKGVMQSLWCIEEGPVVILFVVGPQFTTGAACSLSITLSATELLLWLHTQCYSCYTPALFTITNFFHPQNTILHLFLQHFRNNVNIPITTSRLRLAVLLLVLLLSAFLFLQQDGTITACAKRICKLQVSSFYF